MIRFENISLFGSKLVDEYVVPVQVVGPRIVDDTNFIPMSEAVKQLSKTGNLTKGVIEGYYDFPDGRDDGRKVDVARLRPEIVELSVSAREKAQKLKEDLKTATAKAKKAAADKAFFDSLKVKKEESVKKE